MRKELFEGSLLLTVISAARPPDAGGVKVTSKVVVLPPDGTEAAGWTVTAKSPELVPVVVRGVVRLSEMPGSPLLVIVKSSFLPMLVPTVPKSTVPPFTMLLDWATEI